MEAGGLMNVVGGRKGRIWVGELEGLTVVDRARSTKAVQRRNPVEGTR